jgi:hypothetical protein
MLRRTLFLSVYGALIVGSGPGDGGGQVSDGHWQIALAQLGIPISGLAIHPVVNMVSFSLSFEVSPAPAGEVRFS